MEKAKNWWAIPAVIIFIFVNAYGVILMNAPVLDFITSTLAPNELKISQEVVAKHLSIRKSLYKEAWVRKNGLASTKSAQYQKWLSHNLEVSEANLKNGLLVSTFAKSGETFDEELKVLQKKVIFSAFGENIKHGFLYLFFKGLLVSFFSFVFIIFLNREKINLDDRDESDFEKLFFKVLIISLILTFTIHSIVFYRLVFVSIESVFLSFCMACLFILEYCFFYIITSVFIYIVDYLIILFNWIARMFDRVAYYWLRNRFDGNILGTKTLESLAQKNSFFVFHQKGIQKVVCKQSKENNIPTFCLSEGPVISSGFFFPIFIKDSVDDYLRGLNIKATRKFRKHFSFNGESAVLTYAENFADKIKSRTKVEINEASFKSGKSDYAQTEKILEGILKKSLKLFRQKLILESNDVVCEMTTGLRKILYNEIRREEIFNQNNSNFYCKAALPVNAKFFLSKQDLDIFVIEQTPQRRTVNYMGLNYFLSFPYIIFVVSFKESVFQRLHVFYSEKPLKTLEDVVYRSSFNNVSSDGEVCTGVSDRLKLLTGSLGEKVDIVISSFWQTNFNNDISDCFNEYEDVLGNYWTWAEKSKEQSNFFSTISLIKHESLSRVIDSIVENGLGDVNEFNCAKKLRSTIDSWFEANNSNINESILKLWSGICLNEFSVKGVESFVISRNEEIDNLSEVVKKICLDCADDEKSKEAFLTELIKSFEEVVRKDFRLLLSSVPFKANVSFLKLFNSIK